MKDNMNIQVSIICNTYNHEKYIKKALDGFVMQKTNFIYEVLIHDDASTDNTANIIREYEEAYPDIIKPIYQTENQYSKGVNITDVYHLPRLKGKYIALCEGDDYWIDSLKLQKQFDALESNSSVDICAHAAQKVEAISEKVIGTIAPANKVTIFSTKEVINGGGGFVATNSLFYRRELLENQPEFRKYCPLDYSLQIHGSLRGGMLYLPDIMSAYRFMVPNSWSVRTSNNNQYRLQQTNKIIKMLDLLNTQTNDSYYDIIKIVQYKLKFNCYEAIGLFEELKKDDLKDIYNSKPLSWKLKTYIKEYFPILLSLYRKMR